MDRLFKAGMLPLEPLCGYSLDSSACDSKWCYSMNPFVPPLFEGSLKFTLGPLLAFLE